MMYSEHNRKQLLLVERVQREQTVMHIKTEHVYKVLHEHYINATNDSDGQFMVAYSPIPNPDNIQFVREVTEFMQKFSPIYTNGWD